MKLNWTEPSPPNKDCCYDHVSAETPFSRFLLTWKSWKTESWQDPGYGFDETPWGQVEYHGWRSVEEAKEWAEREIGRRLKECFSDTPLNELLPCPFWGGKPYLVEWGD